MKNTIKDSIMKGIDSLYESVSLLEKGDYSHAMEANKKAVAMIQESIDKMNTEDGLSTALYGNNLNFGKIYSVFEANAPKLFESQKDKVTKIMKAIKDDKTLLDEFKVYNALTNPENVSNMDKYVDSVLSVMDVRKTSDLRESNAKFISLLRKLKLDESAANDNSIDQLYEDVEYMLTNKKSIDNVVEYNNVRNRIVEEAGKRNRTVSKKTVDEVFNERVAEINERYSKELTDDEKIFIKEMSDDNVDKKAIFEARKNSIVNVLKNNIREDRDNKKGWLSILEKVNSKEYNEKTAIEDIAELIEIEETIEK